MKGCSTKNLFAALASSLLALAALGPAVTAAQERETIATETDDAPLVAGEWPGGLRPVTLDLSDCTVASALSDAAGQAGLALLLEDPQAASIRRVTIRLEKRPAREVIELLLRTGSLTARLEAGILVVGAPKEPPAPVADLATNETPVAQAEAAPEAPTDAPAAGVVEDDQEEPSGWKHGRARRHEKKSRGDLDERVQIGRSMRIEPGEEVDSAVVVGGSLNVAGHVRKDAVAVGGGVVLEPGAVVEHDAVAVGGTVEVAPGATLGGNRVGVGGPLGEVVAELAMGDGLRDVPWGAMAVLHTLSKLMRVAVLFVIGLLIVSFAPGRHARVREYLTARPGKSALAGAIIMIATVPLCVLFAVTVIGLPLIPFLLLLVVALVVFGLTAFLTWLGDRLPVFRAGKTPVAALALGAAVFFLVSMVPIAGGAVLMAVSFFGAGAAFLTKLGAPPKENGRATPTPASAV